MFYIYEKIIGVHTPKVWTATSQAELLKVLAVAAPYEPYGLGPDSSMADILAAGRAVNQAFEVMEGIGSVRAAIERGAVCDAGRYLLMRRIRRHVDVNTRDRARTMTTGGPRL